MGAKLAAAITGNVTTNVVAVHARNLENNISGTRGLVITTTVGGSPTVTVTIQGSVDNQTWFSIPYALPATPTTFVTTAIVLTTASTTHYLLSDPVQPNPYAFVRLNLTGNNNVTVTADFYL